MKRWMIGTLLVLALGAVAAAQDSTPSGTRRSPNAPDAVRPVKKHRTGNKTKEAPGDIGRGGKAAGHDLKNGHGIEAGKSIGEGTGRAGKDVGVGTASATTKGARKVGHGAKKLGRKVTGRPDDDDKDRTPPPQ